MTKNAKINREQHRKGDMTIQERIDTEVQKKKNKELLNVVMRPVLDFGLDWHCSLRQNEHDCEFDGLLPLKSFY